MKIVLDAGAKAPTRAHDTDAGLDLYAPDNFYIDRYDSVLVDTGVHIELPKGTVGRIENKSSLFASGALTHGIIDEGYTGSIKVKLYNLTDSILYFNRFEKICQLLVQPVLYPDIEIVDSLEETERGAGGFGSTGKT